MVITNHRRVGRLVALVAILAAFATIITGPSAAAAPASSRGWTTDASVSSAVVAPGGVIDIAATVESKWGRGALIDLEVHGPPGKVFSRVWDEQRFTPETPRRFAASWTVPSDAPVGRYVVKVGVFKRGWNGLWHWNDEADVFDVRRHAWSDSAHAEGGWTSEATVSTATVVPGEMVELAAKVQADTARAALVDLEVHGADGKIFSRVWDGQSFTAGSPRDFTATWQVPGNAAEGTYVVKVGVFEPGWKALLHWNNEAERVLVASDSASEPTPHPDPTTEPDLEPVSPDALPPAPAEWPSTLELGTSTTPDGPLAMRASAPFAFQYKYLAGGVNTGRGWATWNRDGRFVDRQVASTRDAGMIPVFTYYMLYQSKPGSGMSERAGLQANLADPATMAAYYEDLQLFFRRAAEAGGMIVLHVEPDLWAYLQQWAKGDDAATVPVQVASTGVADVAGLPDTADGFAQAIVRLRDRYAPNVVLGYHYSKWGTGNDFIYTNPSADVVDDLGLRTARFYMSLDASFDVAFHDLSDRDAGFKEHVYGDGGASWFDAADYRRSVRYVDAFVRTSGVRTVLWQLPLGNTRMRSMNNTNNHYQDNKVEWLLDDPTRANLNAYANAGVIALLFGRGAGGATCACDANRDGVTNPEPINGNTVVSSSADDDGGFFKARAADYFRVGALPLP